MVDGPRPFGFSGFDSYSNDESAPIRPYKVTSGTTLQGLAEDYVLFNHGVLFSYSDLPVDPAERYIAERGGKLQLLHSPEVLFSNLSNGRQEFKAWEHTLILIPRDDWSDVHNEILHAATLDRDRRRFHRPFSVDVKIHDWFQSSLRSSEASASVVLFGADGNDALVGVVNTVSGAAVSKFPPRRETKEFAKMLLMDKNPYVNPEGNGRKLS
jgi:hypothetical protein